MDSSLLEIVTPSASADLTTLARVKSELKQATNENDGLLKAKIAEASSDVQAAIGFALPSEGIRETFFHSNNSLRRIGLWRSDGPGTGELFLRRVPVTAIQSVTLDDCVVPAGEYRLDSVTGQLYRLDQCGYACDWYYFKSIIVLYTGGYVLPGNPSPTLPPAIEGAVVDLVQQFWFTRGQDPSIKSENIPGVRQIDRWVGSVGDPDLLPPTVLQRLSPFRRPRYAVA
jgi:hypothetical protein